MASFTDDKAESLFRPDFPTSRQSSSSTLGELFKGVGDLVGQGVKAADTVIQTEIDQEVTEIGEDVNRNFGLDVLPDVLNSDDPTIQQTEALPQPLTEGLTRLRRTQTAFVNNKLTETNYFAQLSSGIRNLKNRFPGHKREIDAAVGSLVNTPTANALRSAFFADLRRARTQSEQAAIRKERFIQSAIKSGLLTPEELEIARQSPVDNIENMVARKTSVKFEIDRKASLIRLATAQRGFNQAHVGDYITTLQSNFINENVLDGDDFQIGNKTLNQAYDDFLTNPRANSHLVGPLTQALVIRRDQALAQLQARLNQVNEKGVSVFAMNPEAGSNALKNVTDYYNRLISSLGVDDPSILGGLKAEREMHSILLQRAGQLTETGSMMEVINHMADKNTAIANILVNRFDVFGKAANGARDAQIINQYVTQLARPDIANEAGKTFGEMVSSLEDNIDDPEVAHAGAEILTEGLIEADDEKLVHYVNKLFTDSGYFQKFDFPSRQKLFGIMTSSRVTERLAKMRQTNPALWRQYVNWVKRNGSAFFKPSLDTVVSTISGDAFQNIEFDKSSGQFVVKQQQRGGPRNIIIDVGNEALDLLFDSPVFSTPLQEKVGLLNNYLRMVLPVLEKDVEGTDAATDTDRAALALDLFLENGYDIEGTQFEGTFLDGLGDALIRRVTIENVQNLGTETVQSVSKPVEQVADILNIPISVAQKLWNVINDVKPEDDDDND